jgi:DNA repair exonuclease SbcCD ATPase subunit
MNDRQYFRSSIGELETVVKHGWNSVESLHSISHELNFRNTPRAFWLQRRVERRIQELEHARRKANERKTERAEVKGIINRLRANSTALKSLIEKTVRETIQKRLDQKAEISKRRSLAQRARREREAEIKAGKARIESKKQEALNRLYLSGACSQVGEIEYPDTERKKPIGISSRKARCRNCGRLAVPGSDTCYSCS